MYHKKRCWVCCRSRGEAGWLLSTCSVHFANWPWNWMFAFFFLQLYKKKYTLGHPKKRIWNWRASEQSLLTSSSWVLPTFIPPTPTHTHSLTRHPGIVDHTGNYSCPIGTTGVPPPLHSHYLFVYNIAKRLCSSKAWSTHTVPFFYNV